MYMTCIYIVQTNKQGSVEDLYKRTPSQPSFSTKKKKKRETIYATSNATSPMQQFTHKTSIYHLHLSFLKNTLSLTPPHPPTPIPPPPSPHQQSPSKAPPTAPSSAP